MIQSMQATRPEPMGREPATPETLAAETLVVAAAALPPAIDSTALLKGRRELLIRHGKEFYRLRLTASNKLILTK